MSMSEIEQARHAQERGDILRTLKEDYVREMTSVNSLLRALDAQGVSLSGDGLEFHLVHLAAKGYIQIWRAREMPGWRKDRRQGMKADTVMFARLLPLGLELLDGLAPEDPSVAF
jgi:hypothetical protein